MKVLLADSPVVLHMYRINLAAEVCVLMDAKVCCHVSQPPQHTVPCDLFQGTLFAQGVPGMEPIRELWCLQHSTLSQ